MAFSNTILYRAEWVTRFQDRLDKPQNWKEICNVEYTDLQVLTNPYMSTVPAVAAHTRGTAYTYSTMAFTTDVTAITTSYKHATAIDRADLAQAGFLKQMDMIDLAATALNEQLESGVLGTYGSMTSFDNTELAGSAGNITVSEANVDNIIRAMKRKIIVANGLSLMNQHGAFIVWRPADFEKLEAFVQANGFNTADNALKNGTVPGFHYMGVDHMISNSHTANHLIGGVKNLLHLGIVKSTYGQIVVNQDPYADTGVISGIGVVMRVDYGVKVWNNIKPVLFDIKVA